MELVHVYRNKQIESIHRGDIIITQNKAIIHKYGDPHRRTFWRSAAKPFQVIPFLESGGYEIFGLDMHELAMMTSSHGGETEHVQTVRNILKKMSQDESLLDCGVSRPMYEGEYQRLLKENIPFGACNNPCSGKHTGMIGYGLLNKIELTNYIDKDHVIQDKMLAVISDYTELDRTSIDIAIDGCGVPVFGLPLYNMAIAYEKLSQPGLKIIRDAMTKHPYYVAGTDRLDTIIMEETNGRILAKLGAESVYSMAILKENIGIAIKIDDGAYRALDPLVPSLLLKHDYITSHEFKSIEKRLNLDILNHRKEVVGHYEIKI